MMIYIYIYVWMIHDHPKQCRLSFWLFPRLFALTSIVSDQSLTSLSTQRVDQRLKMRHERITVESNLAVQSAGLMNMKLQVGTQKVDWKLRYCEDPAMS